MRNVRVLLLLATLLVVLAGCGDDTSPPATERGDSQPYALLREPGWALQEAIDPPAGDPAAAVDRPALSWFVEYAGRGPTREATVRLSGHDVPLDEARAELETVGYRFRDVDVAWTAAVGGSSSVEIASPAIVLLDDGSSTLMLLSYQLDAEALAALAGAIEQADEAAWVAAGGVVR